MGLKIGQNIQQLFQKVEKQVEKTVQQTQKTVQKAVDNFESNETVKTATAFVKATVDSFEDAVSGKTSSDPKVMSDHQGKETWNTPKNGQLFVDGITPGDIKQGGAGDCYYLSTLASVADTHPDLIKNAIKDNGDGTYTVTFHVPEGFDALKALGPTGGLIESSLVGISEKLGINGDKTVQVTVDGDLPQYSNGSNIYSHSVGNEQWVQIMEKAYAKLWGGYGAMGNGGSPSTAMYALTGKHVESHALSATGGVGIKVTDLHPSQAKCDKIFNAIKTATDAGKLVVANTYASDSQAPQGLVSGHSYTVLGTAEHDGKKFVQLRNPWGSTEPGADGKDDGIFELPIEQFAISYASYNVGDV